MAIIRAGTYDALTLKTLSTGGYFMAGTGAYIFSLIVSE
jgi:hypothetical protein